MPAPTLAGGTAFAAYDITIGATAAETGILVGDISFTIDNPMVEFFDRWGGVIGKAVNHNASVQLDIQGEVSDSDAGVNVANFTAAATVGNDATFEGSTDTYHGIDFSGTSFWLTAASGSQPRGAGRDVSLSYTKHLGTTDA